jgi:hypothetical protein
MSQQNVEILRWMFDEAQQDPDAMYGMLADDVEWDTKDLPLPGPSTRFGPDGVRGFFRDWVGAFEAWGYEAEEFIDAGEATVVCLHQWGWQGQRSHGRKPFLGGLDGPGRKDCSGHAPSR